MYDYPDMAARGKRKVGRLKTIGGGLMKRNETLVAGRVGVKLGNRVVATMVGAGWE